VKREGWLNDAVHEAAACRRRERERRSSARGLLCPAHQKILSPLPLLFIIPLAPLLLSYAPLFFYVRFFFNLLHTADFCSSWAMLTLSAALQRSLFFFCCCCFHCGHCCGGVPSEQQEGVNWQLRRPLGLRVAEDLPSSPSETHLL
jgi:hypothetical protein